MTNGSLMKVESIAECSTFNLHSVIIGLENQLSVFESGRFTLVLLYQQKTTTAPYDATSVFFLNEMIVKKKLASHETVIALIEISYVF